MLNIPDSIKALYRADVRPDIRKNFRVVFPNGELNDITNDNIVSESVKFTESLMSQQNFRFGLAEAPQISFETVGVANMMGMTIDCFSEIETSTLTAAELAEIESGDYDGTLVDEEDSDIGFGYYRIPLGEFIVQSCPRSHGAMTHRQVQATGRTINATSMDAFTQWKLAQYWNSLDEHTVWIIGWPVLAPSVYGDSWAQAGKYYDATSVTGSTGSYSPSGFKIYLGDDAYYCELTSFPWMKSELSKTGSNYSSVRFPIFRIDHKGPTTTAVSAIAASYAEAVISGVEEKYPGVDWSQAYIYDDSSVPAYFADRSAVLTYLTNFVSDSYAGPFIRLMGTPVLNGKQITFPLEAYGDIDLIFSPSYPTTLVGSTIQWRFDADRFIYAIRRHNVTVVAPNISAGVAIPEIAIDGVETNFYLLTLKSEYSVNMPEVTLPTTLEKTINGTKYYSYYNSFGYADMLTSIFEFNGIFGKRNRDGSIEPYTLATTSQEDLTQSEVDELWWDESTVEPVGKVSVKYLDQDTQEEASAIIQIGDGTSQYNMESNYFLTKFATNLDSVTTLLNDKFATNTAALTWTPTDATVRGLPYLEAGDYLTADTGATDIAEVGFPMLTRDMSGIQSLMDDITSAAGDIIEVTYTSEEEEET